MIRLPQRRWRSRVLFAATTVLLGGCGGATAPDVDRGPGPSTRHTHIRVPFANRPYGIAASLNRAVLVSQLDADKATRLDPDSRTFEWDIPVGSTPTDIAINPAGTRAYVANQYSQSVTVINIATNAVVTTFAVIGDPFKVAVSPNGTVLWVGTNAGRAYALDATSGASLGSVVTGHTPFGFAFGPNDLVYVSTWAAGSVLEVSSRTMTVLRTFSTGGVAQELAISPNGSELYVANEALDRVEVWNVRAGTRSANIAVAGGPFGLILEPDGTHLWTTLSQDGRIAVINRNTRVVQQTYDVGGIPRRIAYDQEGQAAIVTNEHGWLDFFSMTADSVPPMPASPSPIRALLPSRPYGIAASTGGAVFVSHLDAGKTTRVSPAIRRFGAETAVGSTPTDIAINPAGTRAYVANQFSRSVSVIDVATNGVVATFPVTGDPFKVAVSPDGSALYVGTNAGRAFKLDAATGAPLGSVSTGHTPFGFAFGTGDLMYISTWDAGSVLEVDSRTMEVRRIFETGGRAQELAISPDRSELYVANEALSRIEVWNIASGTRTAIIPVNGGPFGLIIEPDGSHLWASLPQVGRVALIDRTARTVQKSYDLGGRTRRIAYDPASNIVMVTNEAGWLDFFVIQ